MTTFVLIHGAYQGGWIWNRVAEQLRAKGHLVLAPTLDGCAERKGQLRAGINTETHADEVAGLLFYNDLKDVVLAGTSTGGSTSGRLLTRSFDRASRPSPMSAMMSTTIAVGRLTLKSDRNMAFFRRRWAA